MNSKYYPQLRTVSAYADTILSLCPSIAQANKQASKPSDMLAAVYEALISILSIDCKDTALEVCKVLFYGYYVEVNAYYNKNK